MPQIGEFIPGDIVAIDYTGARYRVANRVRYDGNTYSLENVITGADCVAADWYMNLVERDVSSYA